MTNMQLAQIKQQLQDTCAELERKTEEWAMEKSGFEDTINRLHQSVKSLEDNASIEVAGMWMDWLHF